MDEFAIDLDKVLDDFEKSEGDVAFGDGLQPPNLERMIILEEEKEAKRIVSCDIAIFEAIDLDLAEADFAPSPWNYEDGGVKLSEVEKNKKTECVLEPPMDIDDKFNENVIYVNDGVIGNQSIIHVNDRVIDDGILGQADVISTHLHVAKETTTNQDRQNGRIDDVVATCLHSDIPMEAIVTDITANTQADVVSACLHSEVAKDNVVKGDRENKQADVVSTCLLFDVVMETGFAMEIVTKEGQVQSQRSTPDVIVSAPDVVSSAIVGVDVLCSSFSDDITVTSQEHTSEGKRKDGWMERESEIEREEEDTEHALSTGPLSEVIDTSVVTAETSVMNITKKPLNIDDNAENLDLVLVENEATCIEAPVETVAVPFELEAISVVTNVTPVEAMIILLVTTPVEAEVTPVAIDVALGEAEVTPVAIDVAPVEAEVTPVAIDVALVEAEVTPVTIDVAPVEAEVTPVAIDVAPVEAEVTPVAIDVATVDAEVTSVAISIAPVKAEVAHDEKEIVLIEADIISPEIRLSETMKFKTKMLPIETCETVDSDIMVVPIETEVVPAYTSLVNAQLTVNHVVGFEFFSEVQDLTEEEIEKYLKDVDEQKMNERQQRTSDNAEVLEGGNIEMFNQELSSDEEFSQSESNKKEPKQHEWNQENTPDTLKYVEFTNISDAALLQRMKTNEEEKNEQEDIAEEISRNRLDIEEKELNVLHGEQRTSIEIVEVNRIYGSESVEHEECVMMAENLDELKNNNNTDVAVEEIPSEFHAVSSRVMASKLLPSLHPLPSTTSLLASSSVMESNERENPEEVKIGAEEKHKTPETTNLSLHLSTTGSSEAMPSDILPSNRSSQIPSEISSGVISHASSPSIPMSSNISLEITQLGKVQPVWLPDAEASKCMECDVPFSFTRRRHHCRACGKVFCHTCSSLRAMIEYLDNKQDRVCSKCYQDLVRASFYERNLPVCGTFGPISGNPNEYSSASSSDMPTAAAAVPESRLPSATVPAGVLRKQGSVKGHSEGKQVMFSDGIRPGGDLTELDGAIVTQPSTRRSKKSEKSGVTSITQSNSLVEAKRSSLCLIPPNGLPSILVPSTASDRDFCLENINDRPMNEIFQQMKNGENPITFAINQDLVVMVKIIYLSCCVNRLCWCFTTKGLLTVGQDEIVILLEFLEDENLIPVDILCHLNVIYETAAQGNRVNNLDHTILPSGCLGSHDIGGFLFIRQSFQCLEKIILPPDSPFLFGLLLQKWEMSWARVFPLRLMFRLGAEFRYYPCPLISVRNRKPVYGEIGHTIMNLLADFHNYQYMVPHINGLVIHMEDKCTTVSIPRHAYNMLLKILSNSDDHVITFGASFSTTADSHLVCLQMDDGSYQTQAINIQNRPRKVTGACFIVFNGALKATSGLRAKSSIVEDGLMVQITSEAMTELKHSLREMTNYKILCGSLESMQPEEMVIIEWTNNEKNINSGVKSPIDELSMYGVENIRIHSATDYVGGNYVLRWTEVFLLRNGSASDTSHAGDVSDISQLSQNLAHGCCQALVNHLNQLAFEMLTKIGLRVTIDMEQVGYEIGSKGHPLPGYCMNDLDERLITIIHGATSCSRSGAIILELIFNIIQPITKLTPITK